MPPRLPGARMFAFNPMLAWLLAVAQLVAADFTVAAAASLGPALDEALAAHAAAGGGHGVGYYAASSSLARQIEQGLPVQLVITADERWMHWLAQRSLIDASSRAPIAGNTLVLVAPATAPFSTDLVPGSDCASAFVGSWTTADPAHVPLGSYAQQALVALGHWPALKPRLLPAADARAALRLVASGEAAAGVVYASDAQGSSAVTVVARFPAESHSPITYHAALVGRSQPAATAFQEFLRGAAGQAILVKHGFTAVADASP